MHTYIHTVVWKYFVVKNSWIMKPMKIYYMKKF